MEHADLYEAIEKRRCIRMSYRGGPRIVEPHGCEKDDEGRQLLRGFQIAGFSPSSERGWKLFAVDEIKRLRLLDETFEDRQEGDPGIAYHRA